MKITDALYVLPIDATTMMGSSVLNLSLILDEAHGPTLVDAGIPGKAEAIEAAMLEAGVRLKDLRRLILTHQDLDHIGSAAAIVRMSGAQVIAHGDDTPVIQGEQPWVKLPPPAALEAMPPQMRAALERGAERVHVDQVVQDGDVLPFAGGVRVVFTPGHTPGHISLYLERDRVLIAGDALSAHEGKVAGPLERATPDMPEALRSVAKLAALDVQTLVAYHGGVVRDDVKAQLEELAKSRP
jgi:glyoxylase-like metal-dependent hydrolase (beta-lactamase superfamily II)